jgi:hypothetical protein
MRDQKPRLRKFACLAAIAAMLALSGRAAERDLDNLLLVRLPAPPEGRRAPLQVMDVPTGEIETSEVAELSPLTFAVIVSGGTVILPLCQPLPVYPNQWTSLDRLGWSGSCHERTSGTLPNRSKTRSYGVRGHLAFWGEGVRLHGGECA